MTLVRNLPHGRRILELALMNNNQALDALAEDDAQMIIIHRVSAAGLLSQPRAFPVSSPSSCGGRDGLRSRRIQAACKFTGQRTPTVALSPPLRS